MKSMGMTLDKFIGKSLTLVFSEMSLKNSTNSCMLRFIFNNYLGLSWHQLLQRDAIRAINQFGTVFCAVPSIGCFASFQKRFDDEINIAKNAIVFVQD